MKLLLEKEKKRNNLSGRLLKSLLTLFILVFVTAGYFAYNQTAVYAADITAPTFDKAEATSKQLVYLTFSEPVKDPIPNGGTISINSGLVVSQVYLTGDARIVRLTVSTQVYGNKYPTPNSYTVTVTNIKDLLNNNLASASQSFDAFTPHGKYAPATIASGNSTRMCGQCHTAHGSVGNQLLNRITLTKVCFVCHGTGGISIYIVDSEFNLRGGTPSVSLHKALDYQNPGADILYCTDCHNPHGDRRSGNEIYPKLLKAANVAGTVYYQGNGFCLACHGVNGKAFKTGTTMSSVYASSTYYDVTGGDHTNANAAHYDTAIDAGAMLPPSGTQITCVKCHERHGSKFTGLIDNTLSNREEALCFKSGCHGTTNPVKNIYDKFYGAGLTSRHRIEDNVRGKVECSSCHGPHTVRSTFSNKISNPDNTKQLSSNGNAFCLKCHDNSPPVKTTNATTIVPYSVYFNNSWITSNSPGWDKSLFVNSGHGTSGFSVAACSGCHTWHGSKNLNLIRDDAGTGWQYGVDHTWAQFPSMDGCLGLCHRNDVSGVADTNIYTPFSQAYKHPTFSVNGVHVNTEKWADKNVTRHAECMDCHDVHTAKAGAGQTDILGRVSGAKGNPWSSGWGNYGTGTTMVGVFLSPTMTDPAQAYLCFKCHSKYAYTPGADDRAPFDNPSNNTGTAFKQTDVAREFNPNVKAKHIVIPGQSYSNIPGGYGSFTGSWTTGFLSLTSTSVLKCTDCHGPGSGANGPHGSTNKFILVAPWNPGPTGTRTGAAGTKATTGNHLCFKCHDFDFYTNATNQPGQPSSFRNNGSDNWHQAKGEHQLGCGSCHGGLPHGWKYTNTTAGEWGSVGAHGIPLWGSGEPAPYGTGSIIGTQPTKGAPWDEHSSTSCNSLTLACP